MVRFLIIAVLIFPLLACKQAPRQPEAKADSIVAAVVQSAPDTSEAAAKTLLEYSPYDTCSGEFKGSYQEKHGDLTVIASVIVRLDSCRITRITFTDSSNLNSEAIKVIPERIIETQRVPVDEVSGASVSSWIIMTAAANALGVDLLKITEQL